MRRPSNAPVSQVDIEEEMLRLVDLLEDETEAFERVCEDEAKKSAKHKSDWAKAYLGRSGVVKEREAWATYETSDAHHDAALAEGLMRAKREKLHTLRVQIDALRTLAANVRNQT